MPFTVLVLQRKGQQFSPSTVNLRVCGLKYYFREVVHRPDLVVKRSGIKKKISPHSFRHTSAVHYLNRGGSIFLLQKLLGHEYITTTLNYLKYAKIPYGGAYFYFGPVG